MRKFCLLLISLTILPMLWFSSCAKDESDNDGISPQVENIRFNFNDTIRWNGTNITINDTTTNVETDTLVIGKRVYLSGRFFSNKQNALSGYKVVIYYNIRNKKTQDEQLDSLKAVGAFIYRETDITIQRNNLMLIPDSVSKRTGTGTTTANEIYYPVEGEYNVKIFCGDIYGNIDSIPHKVRILSRESIYNSRYE